MTEDMKFIYYKPFLLLALLLVTVSCDEDEFLEERPLDFFSPENSFVSMANFESSLADLYAAFRNIHFTNENFAFAHVYGTDVMKDARESPAVGRIGDYVIALNPTGGLAIWHWERWYKIISSANTVINRLEGSELTSEQRIFVEAEARLFRAFAYRYLVYLYGGVPVYTEELASPRADFTRATREEVLNQIVEDAVFSAQNLSSIADVVDGRLSDLVAWHLLAETYISLERWDDAVAAASVVIDDSNTAMMTERFGSRASETPGDVYWDLFRMGNQNRAGGNTEAIWVSQMEVDIPGGFVDTDATIGPNILERHHVPVSWTLNDPDGNSGMLGPRSDDNIGGRGVSFLRPTDYFENTIWQSDFDNDIRNAEHNYKRTIIYDNPESAWFGANAFDNPGSVLQGQDWRWYPYLTKVTTPGNHPDNLYSDASLGLLRNNAGSTYTDQYYIRLAETYLLRAEAHLGKGDAGSAALDINVVRERASASPVSPGQVDIDYILEERARELSMEEERRITLQRLDKLVERVRLYNDHNGDEIQDYHRLWPIPAGEIEANINADLQQNPGY